MFSLLCVVQVMSVPMFSSQTKTNKSNSSKTWFFHIFNVSKHTEWVWNVSPRCCMASDASVHVHLSVFFLLASLLVHIDPSNNPILNQLKSIFSMSLCLLSILGPKVVFVVRQGSTNCGILASGVGGGGDRERKWEGKFHSQGLKMVFLH